MSACPCRELDTCIHAPVGSEVGRGRLPSLSAQTPPHPKASELSFPLAAFEVRKPRREIWLAPSLAVTRPTFQQPGCGRSILRGHRRMSTRRRHCAKEPRQSLVDCALRRSVQPWSDVRMSAVAPLTPEMQLLVLGKGADKRRAMASRATFGGGPSLRYEPCEAHESTVVSYTHRSIYFHT